MKVVTVIRIHNTFSMAEKPHRIPKSVMLNGESCISCILYYNIYYLKSVVKIHLPYLEKNVEFRCIHESTILTAVNQ